MAGNACLPAKWMCTVLSVDTNPPGTAFQVPFQATFDTSTVCLGRTLAALSMLKRCRGLTTFFLL